MKAFVLALPLAVLAANSAIAADPIEKQVLITATVPTAAFYVEPVGGNWMNDPQDMAWNSFQGTLEPIRKQLQAKSTIGPITAHLLTPAAVTSSLAAALATGPSAGTAGASQAGAGRVGAALDLAHLQRLVGDDQQALRGLLNDLRGSLTEDSRRLQQQSDDPKELAVLAHRIKGGAQIARAGPLLEACEELERCCRQQPSNVAVVQRAKHALHLAMHQLEGQLEKLSAEPVPGHIMPSSNSTNRTTRTAPMMPDGP